MLKAVQQQSLFDQISASDLDGRKFIEACNELDYQIVISARDNRPGYEGNTLLHEAARVGSPEAVLHLIEIGHTVDCIDTSLSRVTPLLVAIQAGNLDIVGILMRSGASLHRADIRGDNALHYGARCGSRMCKLLLRHPEMSSLDYRTLLGTENAKLVLPVEYAANPFIEKLFTAVGGRNASRKGPRRPKKQKEPQRGEPAAHSPAGGLGNAGKKDIDNSAAEEKADEATVVQEKLPGKMTVVRVTLIDMPNTELVGKPDLYATLSISGQSERLPTKDSCDPTVTWDSLSSFFVEIVPSTLQALEVSVYDENKLRSDVCIGTCSLDLGKLRDQDWQTGGEVILGSELPPDRKSRPCGRVEIGVVVEPA